MFAALLLAVMAVGFVVWSSGGGQTATPPCDQLVRIADDVNSGRIDNLESARRVAKLNTEDSRNGVRLTALAARASAQKYLSYEGTRPESASIDLVQAIVRMRDQCAHSDDTGLTEAVDSAGAPAAQIGDVCLVGTWRAEQLTIFIGTSGPLTGGASTVMAFGADGHVAIDYSASSEWNGSEGDQRATVTQRGLATQRASAGGGMLQLFAGDTSHRFVTQTINGQPLVINPAPDQSTRPYACDTSTLTIQNDQGLPPDTYSRTG
ncbi:MAG: hypothetical protein QOD92_4290 [Acidimicrobiaceae bacterium]|jgi:hypothetical protein